MHKIIAFCTLIVMALMLVVATITTMNGGYWLGCCLTLGDIFSHPFLFFGAALMLGFIAAYL